MFRLFHIALLLAMIGLGALGISRLSYNVEILDLLPKGMPGVQGTALFQRLMDRPDRLIITLKADTDVLADDAATALSTALQNDAKLARQVRSQPAWESHPADMLELVALAWLNAPADKLTVLEASLSPAQIAATLKQRIAQLGTAMDPVAVALNSNDVLGLTSATRDTLDPSTLESMGGGGFANSDGTFRVLYADAPKPIASYRDAAAWIAQLREVAARVVPAGVTVGYTGGPAFQAEIGSGMESDMSQSVSGITFIVGFLFWLMHRQIRPLFLILLAMLGTGLITLGLAGLIFGSLNVMSMGFAAILMGMIEDFGVLGLSEAMHSPGQSYQAIHRRIYPSIWWSAITSAAVFGSLGLSTLPGIAQMGVLTSLGILVGAAVMLYGFLPIVMKLRGVSAHAPVADSRDVSRGIGVATISIALLCIGVIALLGLPGVASGTQVLRPKHCQAFESLLVFDRELKPDRDAVVWLPILIEAKDEATLAATLDRVQTQLRDAQTRGHILSHYLPTAAAPYPVRQAANLPRLAALAKDRPRLFDAAASAGVSDSGIALAKAVMERWETWATEGNAKPRWPDLVKLEDALGSQLQRGDQSLIACGFMRLAKSDAVFASPVIAGLQSHEGVHVAGWEYLNTQLQPVMAQEVQRVLLPAVSVLALLFFIVFRNARERCLALGSLAFSGLILLAAMSVIGMEWNFVNVGTIPLCLGLGLDFNINILYALRSGHTPRVSRALAYCGLSTGLGFGALAMSDNVGLASFGVCSMIGVLATLFVAAFAVPWAAERLQSTKQKRFAFTSARQ